MLFLDWNMASAALGITLSIVVPSWAMIRYLNHSKLKGGLDFKGVYRHFMDLFERHSNRIRSLEVELKKLKIKETVAINEEERLKILSSIKDKIENDSVEQYFKNLVSRIEKEHIDKLRNASIQSSIERLRHEMLGLTRRANLNLVIGVMISFGGSLVAYQYVINLPSSGEVIELLSYSLPRLSLFALFTLLIFFFLNLYKKSLADIKYYQNEITNLEAKYLSLQIALSMNNHKVINSMLENIVKTERNFILEKDQSTIELEKERLNSNNANSVIDMLKEMISSKK